MFDFCVAQYGADDLLSIAVINSSTGEAMVLKCDFEGALSIVEELGSTLELRAFEIFHADPDEKDDEPPPVGIVVP